MIEWSQQGGAVVGPLSLLDGRTGKIVLVGSRDNSKGAVVVVTARGSDSIQKTPLTQLLDTLAPRDVVDILCMQERVFGSSGLESPKWS